MQKRMLPSSKIAQKKAKRHATTMTSQGKSANQAEPTQKHTDMQELINKQQNAERQQDNLLLKIQQMGDSRSLAQQDLSAGAQRDLSAGAPQDPSTNATNTPQMGQTAATARIDARVQPQNVSLDPAQETIHNPHSPESMQRNPSWVVSQKGIAERKLGLV